MVSIDGGSASKFDDVTAYPEPSQDGRYVLLWQRYDKNKMVAMRYYGNVFYIFNSTVIDWTSEVFFIVYFLHLYDESILQGIINPTLLIDASYCSIKIVGSAWLP